MNGTSRKPSCLREGDDVTVWPGRRAVFDGRCCRPLSASLHFALDLSGCAGCGSSRRVLRSPREGPSPNRVLRSTDGKPKWHVPSGWQEAAAGQFLVAKFVISGENKSQAAVNISAAGGELSDNVNRWRSQLALAPLSKEEIEKLVQPLAVPGGKAILGQD